jgi:hypothetical protein
MAEWSRALDINKAKRLVLQCINGVSPNPVEGEQNKLASQKSNSYMVGFNFQTCIYMKFF